MSDTSSDVLFPAVRGRDVACRFDGGDLSSDAGVLLVALADEKVGLTGSMAGAVCDRRQQGKVKHSILDMLRERIYAIACGYEDANDLDRLGDDPALKTACDRLPITGRSLASQPTISRLENSLTRRELLKMGLELARRVVENLPANTNKVIIDVDDTDDPCHGQQEFEFFNGYYGEHCYKPLYVHLTVEGSLQWLLGAVLRPGNSSATKGLLGILRMAVRLLRSRFPEVEIILRADSGFGIWDVMKFCRDEGLDYVLGLASNKALQRLSTPIQMDTALKYKWEGDGCREYGEFCYKAKTWDEECRVIVKSEITLGKLNPRFVLSSLKKTTAEDMYEFYCLRANQENRIKEMKLDISSGRTSCHRFLANQCRLLLHTAACVLMGLLQEGLSGTKWAGSQVGTVRLRLLKVGARVVQSCRRIWFHLPTSYPEQDIWRHLQRRLAQVQD